MISDRFVIGDNIYLNELRNFFFEVLGMMSVTHYGAIGDGRTDNYASLQVAIDDANRRGLCYIYVPYGRYRFRGNLINRDNITFIGNPRAKIFNDRTGEEIEIKQFGVPCCGNKGKIIFLERNLILVDGVAPTLTTGSYHTDGHVVTINGQVIIPRGTPFYYDASTNTLGWLTGYARYQDGTWTIYEGPEPFQPEEDDEMKSIITAELTTGSINAESGVNEITLDTSVSGGTIPNLLTLSDGGIVVGEGVTKVKVSGMLYFTPAFFTIGTATAETIEYMIMVKRNGEVIKTVDAFLRYYHLDEPAQVTASITPKILDVQSGDKIVVGYNKLDGTGGYIDDNTFLTVEVANYDGSNTLVANPTI